VHCLQPVVDILARPISRNAIAFLDLAFELLALAVDLGQIVVGELTLLFLDLSLGLLPISFQAIPVHRRSSRTVVVRKTFGLA
jgi:hypothetical protein